MREDAYSSPSRQALRVQWILLFSLLLAACGGEGDGRSDATSPTLLAAPPQAAAGAGRMGAPGMSSTGQKPVSPAAKDDTDEPSLNPAKLAQISALPHLSALSAREKAGLLLLLSSKSSSERMVLINMYPSVAQLPIQQKEVLLANLEKIVPSTTSQSR